MAFDRNLADAHARIGIAKYFMGGGRETDAHVHEALRLSPRDTNAHHWMVFAGNAKQQLGADEEAAVWYR